MNIKIASPQAHLSYFRSQEMIGEPGDEAAWKSGQEVMAKPFISACSDMPHRGHNTITEGEYSGAPNEKICWLELPFTPLDSQSQSVSSHMSAGVLGPYMT